MWLVLQADRSCSHRTGALALTAIAKTITKPLREVRDNLTDLCTKVLLAYRKHCASTTSPGQVSKHKLYHVVTDC